jgi:hypothetical protein
LHVVGTLQEAAGFPLHCSIIDVQPLALLYTTLALLLPAFRWSVQLRVYFWRPFGFVLRVGEARLGVVRVAQSRLPARVNDACRLAVFVRCGLPCLFGCKGGVRWKLDRRTKSATTRQRVDGGCKYHAQYLDRSGIVTWARISQAVSTQSSLPLP